MPRSIRLLVCGLALSAASAGQARAQYYYPYGYGYGGYGFGGFGGTVQGSIARGLGVYAAGEGVYNYDTAVAESIDANTIMRFNQYMYDSELEARRRYNRHNQQRMALDDAHYNAHLARIRDNPSKDDIDSGDALNTILDQMSDPKLMHGSTLRLANGKIPAASIREIPFRDETDAITLSLDEMTDPKNWPIALRSEALRPEREAYQKAIDDALAEDKEGGSLKPETVARVRNAVAALYRKTNDTIAKGSPDHNAAVTYLRGLAGLSRMLERPNVEAVLSELEKMESTTVGNLLGFMHSYNLRFAPATTPKQRAIYRELLPSLADARDRIVGRPGENNAANNNNNPPPPASPSPDHAVAPFRNLDDAHLFPPPPAGNPANTNPAPAPAPTNPAPPANPPGANAPPTAPQP